MLEFEGYPFVCGGRVAGAMDWGWVGVVREGGSEKGSVKK